MQRNVISMRKEDKLTAGISPTESSHAIRWEREEVNLSSYTHCMKGGEKINLPSVLSNPFIKAKN